MKKKEERVAFNFYKSYFTSLELLNDAEKLEFLLGLFNRQFYGVEPQLSKMAQMVYMTQKHSVDKQVEGWESKTKTKLTPSVGGYVGSNEGGYVGSNEGKLKNLVYNSVMTTEDPIQDPSVGSYKQEQENGKEKEKEQVEELDMFSKKAQKMAEIEFERLLNK